MPAPNVLLVVTDQQRPDLIGAAGRIPVETPAADRLCREGTMFTRAYAACPLCTPSRASIVSGQYPSRNGTWTNGVVAPDEMLSVPRLLSERAGYRTAIVGKSHLRPGIGSEREQEVGPDDPGFERAPYDFDLIRGWTGPWYGFEYARICTGHTYLPVSYSLHYGAWLEEQGVPNAPPFFMDRAQARELGEHMLQPLAFTPSEMARREPLPLSTWAIEERYHQSRWVADEVISYLESHVRSHPDRPFFVSANIPDPHSPYVAPEPWDRMYEDVELPPPVRRVGEWEGKPTFYRALIEGTVAEGGWHSAYPPEGQRGLPTPTEERTPREDRWWRTYLGMQSLADKHIGRMLDALDALGLAGDTVVVVTSDHGDQMGDHFLWHKGACHYDACARVPFIVRWPGRVPAGGTSAELQSLADLAPTFMRAAGLDPHPEMQGVDQTAAWEGGGGVRDGVLIEHPVESGLEVNSWVTAGHRLSVYADHAHARTELELYDLEADPGELDSLADDPGSQGLLRDLLGDAWRHVTALKGPWPERIARA